MSTHQWTNWNLDLFEWHKFYQDKYFYTGPMHELRFLFRIINLTRRDDNKQINSSSLTSMPAIITRELRISPIRLSMYIRIREETTSYSEKVQ